MMLREKERPSGVYRIHRETAPEQDSRIGFVDVLDLLKIPLDTGKTLVFRFPDDKTKEEIIDALKQGKYLLTETDTKFTLKLRL